jgi:hypothetical protein
MMAKQRKAQGRVALHKKMLCRIEILEGDMAHIRRACTERDFRDIKKAIAVLKAQPKGRIPVGDYGRARGAKSVLEKIASKLENKQPLPFWPEMLRIYLTELAKSVSDWLHS